MSVTDGVLSCLAYVVKCIRHKGEGSSVEADRYFGEEEAEGDSNDCPQTRLSAHLKTAQTLRMLMMVVILMILKVGGRHGT